ncbi:glycyl radical protein [Clostridium tertium]|jgi:pyruvate formate-lyase/glycerol dehydratase family glycyl radical enzyme|uniref:glycyl radical protein n=1 Tax=Clostridium TaxID=1485 RepID=UPI001157C2A2|nr:MULTISPECIES: glycyl radical protein [Clostridium]MBS5305881.1 glycyl radical protein [Clostridium sp.]MDB1921011.1 glycyl radical protein [Clostridium tertium]MDB1925541.1 glycyl radical protein [Clostridium tertium]MDB1928624.1 glycyl radical protein [Clostridium tertium]MDB1943581.1 glycyl radical protein [Clostridium tertium]
MNNYSIPKSSRIDKLINALFEKMPEIEADRGILITESYMKTKDKPIITRRAEAFAHILKNIPIVIRDNELIVGSTSKSPRGCQVFPEFSFSWLEDEFDTIEKRLADPFYISEETKELLKKSYHYWKGKTTSELATSYMAPEAIKAIEHNIFTPGNYYYNGVGHVTVCYDKILKIGYEGIIKEAENELKQCNVSDMNYASKSHFLNAVILSCKAVIDYAKRYSILAKELAEKCNDDKRRKELEIIAKNCDRVPEKGARNFNEACQSFWFVQMLLQLESSGHSISPGRFDQYMYPYYEADIKSGKINKEQVQELIDCIWVKLNDLNKVRDAASAEGFAGYGLFQNLIVGGQDGEGVDVTNDLSYMCIEASLHVMLPQPSLSVRVWNKTPHNFLIKAATLTRTGIGLPAYYNDEVIIPSLLNRGLTLKDSREYNIIGCVEPQKAGKTEGWHDAAFFNMCRPLELVFENGMDKGELIGVPTGDVSKMKSFDEFYDAYKTQMNYCIELLVNACNAIDLAHRERCPLPYLSCMIDDCIKRGKSVQEGGAIYNFTGPQGFGIANMADSLYAIKELVFNKEVLTLGEYREALRDNYGKGVLLEKVENITKQVVKGLLSKNIKVNEEQVFKIVNIIKQNTTVSEEKKKKYEKLLDEIDNIPKFGNDISEVDSFARDVAYTYTKPLEKYKNPREGQYQAGLYPVSANVPLGGETGATPDGRLAHRPVADGVSPSAGKDIKGPTAAANSVSKLDHSIASNGTLFNQKFHPSALSGRSGLESFVSFIRGYFDQKGSHIQFNVVSKETLLDAQKNPEEYKTLVVRVAGYSALFTSLSRSLQDDIINRTEQNGF